MYLNRFDSRSRHREAENARRNRAEVVKALSQGQVTRRELIKWGIFTTTGALAMTNGLNPYARSQILPSFPTGAPPSPLFGSLPFTQPLPRLDLQTPVPLTPVPNGPEVELAFPAGMLEPNAKRQSWHTDFSVSAGTRHRNPLTGIGPMEGRPPGEYFAHQRWLEYLPKKAYVMNLGPVGPHYRLHPDMPDQGPASCWSFGARTHVGGSLPPPLLKLRYGEPVIFRHYNQLPTDPAQNGGFGSISQTTHLHNLHSASTSDGASNAHFFPGQFYDYHWGMTLARADMTNRFATDKRASGPNGNGGLVNVPGDWRELQGTLWFHDHRFFYTAENVYKGHVGMANVYSGRDRGNEALTDGVNLRLPSGFLLDWGNVDFDVNLMISDGATDQDGQYFFDIFNTDGFLGDLVMVNFAYKPNMDVIPRKYRFRLLCASMSRFYSLALVNQAGKTVPVKVIATDGNFTVKPVTVNRMDTIGPGERLDIIVDFTPFKPGDKLRLVNSLQFEDGRGPDKLLSISDTLNHNTFDPGVGDVMQFTLVDQVESVDVPGVWHRARDLDRSTVPASLTAQIPVVTPVRERMIEFKRGGDDAQPCFPDCPDRDEYPWTIRINGQDTHSLNANRIAMLVPRPGEVEHWTLINPSGGWDHPVHLHFEEGVTVGRIGYSMTATERLSRKDVWRMQKNGAVKIQVRFGEYGGAYVTHCHNTVHEDAAMLMRYDVLTDAANPKTSKTHVSIIPTPNPTPQGVTYVTPEILPEGNPFDPSFQSRPAFPASTDDS